jgi:hypothetical protein
MSIHEHERHIHELHAAAQPYKSIRTHVKEESCSSELNLRPLVAHRLARTTLQYRHRNTIITIPSSKYCHSNTIITIPSSKYCHRNAIITIPSSKYRHRRKRWDASLPEATLAFSQASKAPSLTTTGRCVRLHVRVRVCWGGREEEREGETVE